MKGACVGGNYNRVCVGLISAITDDTYVRFRFVLIRFIVVKLKAICLKYTATAKMKRQPFMYVAKGNQMKPFPHEGCVLQSVKDVKT